MTSHAAVDDSDNGSSPMLSLLVTCAAMFAGAFLAGSSCFKLDKRQLAWLNCFACGLLLGTALGVIIPEGVHSLYEGGGGGHEHHHHEHEYHAEEKGEFNHEGVLGWTLLLGFLTMMFIEGTFNSIVGGSGGGHGHSHDSLLPATEGAASEGAAAMDATARRNRRSTITLGLLIHNAMDGLAMGAAKASSSSSSSSSSNMEHVVFAAIMMHHVPAAFGYATLLRTNGLTEEADVRRFILVFSLAAPVACAITFLVLHRPTEETATGVSPRAVGVCLLYSAGTFLYVACVHALDDAKRGFPAHRWGPSQLAVLSLGALVPGIASWGHSH